MNNKLKFINKFANHLADFIVILILIILLIFFIKEVYLPYVVGDFQMKTDYFNKH